MLDDVCSDHDWRGVCWKCSDQVSWWREVRGGRDPFNRRPEPPCIEYEDEPVLVAVVDKPWTRAPRLPKWDRMGTFY